MYRVCDGSMHEIDSECVSEEYQRLGGEVMCAELRCAAELLTSSVSCSHVFCVCVWVGGVSR